MTLRILTNVMALYIFPRWFLIIVYDYYDSNGVLTVNPENLELISLNLDRSQQREIIEFNDLDYGYENERRLIRDIISSFRNSVKKIRFKLFHVRNFEEFGEIFDDLPVLEELEFDRLSLINRENLALREIPSLKTPIFRNVNLNVFSILTNQQSVTKVIVQNDSDPQNTLWMSHFNALLETFSNLVHLVLSGGGTATYFEYYNLPTSIKTLELETLSIPANNQVDRMQNFQQLRDNLKDLRIKNFLPNFNGDETFNFLVNNMNLETFYLNDIPLILNGQKQDILEIEATDADICCCFEILRLFCKYFYNSISIIFIYHLW